MRNLDLSAPGNDERRRPFIVQERPAQSARGVPVASQNELLPLADRGERLALRADEFRSRADEAVVRPLLEHVRAPADRAGDGERRGEHVAGQADRGQYGRRVELDVGIQPPPWLA